MELAGSFNEAAVQYVGLGLTKASHEFLMLHYFATDSAQIWNDLDATQDLVFPDAPSRRAHAYRAFLACHVAPSYRRMPHPLDWKDANLLSCMQEELQQRLEAAADYRTCIVQSSLCRRALLRQSMVCRMSYVSWLRPTPAHFPA